jgi:hypothetical protein
MAHFNFRLFLRPTLVGKIIIDRLTAEGADRQAEARRWIELGYMCEQAGFRLEGNTLFQAGRPATAEASLTTQLPVHSMPVAAMVAPEVTPLSAQRSPPQPASLDSRAQAPAPSPVEIETSSPSTRPNAPPAISPAPASQLDSELLGNLRNLAH